MSAATNNITDKTTQGKKYEISSKDLPLHCPLDSMSLWNSHPRVYLPIEETGQATCPYCGSEYLLKKDD